MSLWDGSEDEKFFIPPGSFIPPSKETTVAKSHDLEHIPNEELQAELNRRKSMAMHKELKKRDRIGLVLTKVCNEIPEFRELLVPNPKSELYQAIFGDSMDYEITLTCFHNPLNKD